MLKNFRFVAAAVVIFCFQYTQKSKEYFSFFCIFTENAGKKLFLFFFNEKGKKKDNIIKKMWKVFRTRLLWKKITLQFSIFYYYFFFYFSFSFFIFHLIPSSHLYFIIFSFRLTQNCYFDETNFSVKY